MNRRFGKLTGLLILPILVINGCQREPIPFRLTMGNYHIQFPTTSAELQRTYPQARESHLVVLTDTSGHEQAVWKFDQSLKDPLCQPYGVLITLFDKSPKMDSIQGALERKYGQAFGRLKMPVYLGKYETYQPDSSLRVMQVNPDVQISISRQNVWPVGEEFLTKNVIISICYGRDKEENERFALMQTITRDKD